MRNDTVKTTTRFSTLLILFVGVLAPLRVFGLLADDVMEKEMFFFDKPTLIYLHSHATPVFDAVMRFFTRAGSALALIPFNAIVFAVLMWRRRRWAAAFWTAAVVGAALLNWLAKQVFSRTRPDLWISSLPETTFSFPSGHAMQSVAVVAALTAMMWSTRWKWLALVPGSLFVLLVGLSRLYLGVHYPSDILAGWTASLAWVVGIGIIFRKHLDLSQPLYVKT